MATLNMLMKSLNIILLLSTYSTVATSDPSVVENALACEHSTLSIQCEPGQEIRVQGANYGRLSPTICNENGNMPTFNLNCLSTISLAIVSAQCNRKQSCSVPAENTVFGDPCQKTYKYLNVDYECVSTVRKEIACEKTTPLNIVCEPGYVISVLAANYGRLSPTVCNENGKMPIYDLNCLSGSSYVIVSAQCNQQQSCSVSADNSVFGDPCVKTYKYLTVDYECIPQ